MKDLQGLVLAAGGLNFRGLAAQVFGDEAELLEGRFQVFDDFGGDDVGIGQVICILQQLMAQPEDVQVNLVAGHDFVVGIGAPSSLL